MLLNDDSLLDVHDLEEAFSGGMFYSSEAFGYWNTASAPIALGRIGEEKKAIDLYIWIDRHKNDTVLFRFQSSSGQALARRFFRCPIDVEPCVVDDSRQGTALTLDGALRELASKL